MHLAVQFLHFVDSLDGVGRVTGEAFPMVSAPRGSGPIFAGVTAEMCDSADKRILVVDDDEPSTRLMRALLSGEGYTVQAAVSGEHALELIAQDRPDVILLDLELPGMSGLDLVRALKRDSATCDILVVAITALSHREIEAAALAAGCRACVAKPIDALAFSSFLGHLLAAT